MTVRRQEKLAAYSGSPMPFPRWVAGLFTTIPTASILDQHGVMACIAPVGFSGMIQAIGDIGLSIAEMYEGIRRR